MTYFSYTEKELSKSHIQEGELAIYTGTVNPLETDTLTPHLDSKNAHVFLWQNGQPYELDASFLCDMAGANILEAQTGEETYIFLRDKPSGYIRQISGPARPIVVANFGAIPLRVDTFLGKFTVCAGTIQRLDENAPRREKKKVLLNISSRYDQFLESAELWDGSAWRRLNIREEPDTIENDRGLAVIDGSAIVQYIKVNRYGEILMMDAPEPDPDYEIFVSGKNSDRLTLHFNRSDYRDGQVVQRVRSFFPFSWGESVAYDLQKLRDSRTQREAEQCTAELPKWPAASILEKRVHPLRGDKLQAFLEDRDEAGGTLPAPGEASAESERENCRTENAPPQPAELPCDCLEAQETPTPEQQENFPE